MDDDTELCASLRRLLRMEGFEADAVPAGNALPTKCRGSSACHSLGQNAQLRRTGDTTGKAPSLWGKRSQDGTLQDKLETRFTGPHPSGTVDNSQRKPSSRRRMQGLDDIAGVLTDASPRARTHVTPCAVAGYLPSNSNGFCPRLWHGRAPRRLARSVCPRCGRPRSAWRFRNCR